MIASWGPAQTYAADPPAADAVAEQRFGRFIRVESPITDRVRRHVERMAREVVQQAKRRDANALPILVFELRPGQSDFGNATELARFLASDALGGATTIAFVPEDLTGHTALVALACQEIIMAPEAKLGAATPHGENIPAGTRAEYADIARRRMTVPPAVAVAMLDPAVELYVAETNNDRRFLLGEELEAARAAEPGLAPKLIKPQGEPGLFSGEQGRELGFVKSLASDRAEVAKQLGLPREALVDDPSLAGGWRPIRISINGPITARVAEQNQSIIHDQMEGKNVNLVVVWLDSEGGSVADAAALANDLASLNPAEVRTVAYVPTNASGDATLVALACDQIVMHKQAQLGGDGAMPFQPEDRQLVVRLSEEIARQKQRSPSLAGAFFDGNRRVFSYVRAGDGFTEYFTEDELQRQGDKDDWRQGAEITKAGQPLRLTSDRAEELGLAWQVVDDFGAFKTLYGLEADPTLVEPGWADTLIDALNSAAVSWLILVVGLWALYFELHSPGVGLGGFLAGICFLLFFWSHHLNGTAGWLEILLFVAGLGCLVLEVFVLPGFGVFGIGGGAMIITSLVLASQTFVLPGNASEMHEMKRSLLVVVGAGAGFMVAAVSLQRFLPHTPWFSRIVLAPLTHEEADELGARESMADWQHLLGCQGVTTTRLAPAGKAQFGDALLDVTSPGQYVAAGQPVEVIEVHGAHVVVREISAPA
ncbi:MAG: NfeD family protein [Planctomycetia bacterium]|nr:NfeD family protein [Planctomycetia bacterium]